MSLFNTLPVAFPFYDKKEMQTRFKAKDDFNFPHLISPNDAILPFQFRRGSDGLLPISWKLFDLDDNEISDLSIYIPDLGVQTVGYFDYFWMSPVAPMIIGDPASLKMNPGCYYVRFQFENVSPDLRYKYSETFKVPQDSFSVNDYSNRNYISFTWKNYGAVSPIYYPKTDSPEFLNQIFLDSRITSSEPEIESEVNKDGYGLDVPIYERAVIRYRVTAFVADYLKIALYAMQIHDSIFLSTEKNLEVGKIERVNISSTVEQGGFTSTIDVLFEQDILIIGTACNDLPTLPCPEMPTSEELEFTVALIDGNYRITATLPAGFSGANIYRLVGGDWEFIRMATTPELLSGAFVPPEDGTTAFKIELLTFNCIVGESEPFEI